MILEFLIGHISELVTIGMLILFGYCCYRRSAWGMATTGSATAAKLVLGW